MKIKGKIDDEPKGLHITCARAVLAHRTLTRKDEIDGVSILRWTDAEGQEVANGVRSEKGGVINIFRVGKFAPTSFGEQDAMALSGLGIPAD